MSKDTYLAPLYPNPEKYKMKRREQAELLIFKHLIGYGSLILKLEVNFFFFFFFFKFIGENRGSVWVPFCYFHKFYNTFANLKRHGPLGFWLRNNPPYAHIACSY